ncbi:hypothetical protein T440DRAFT_280971 [Plenodomus tracheiphilus IPT5]|uniref:Uncharacterized protein n=1 Tax=Plenodomus tracheiphilus IPT5 TaxID=1408161 RepID=A0A6A7APZ5_9PLEO|nr:hypothetical protein T440DRAFT_280971 [Plenodomus tracheiphilus IPT5]
MRLYHRVSASLAACSCPHPRARRHGPGPLRQARRSKQWTPLAAVGVYGVLLFLVKSAISYVGDER